MEQNVNCKTKTKSRSQGIVKIVCAMYKTSLQIMCEIHQETGCYQFIISNYMPTAQDLILFILQWNVSHVEYN